MKKITIRCVLASLFSLFFFFRDAINCARLDRNRKMRFSLSQVDRRNIRRPETADEHHHRQLLPENLEPNSYYFFQLKIHKREKVERVVMRTRKSTSSLPKTGTFLRCSHTISRLLRPTFHSVSSLHTEEGEKKLFHSSFSFSHPHHTERGKGSGHYFKMIYRRRVSEGCSFPM